MAMQVTKSAQPPAFRTRIPPLKAGKYADGTPFHEPTYLCCKLLLKTEHLTSAKALQGFAKVVAKAATKTGVECTDEALPPRPVIREVLFLDTKERLFYNNAFILRRRIQYKDGFPFGEPEIVFKFRHSDLQKVAETDVRPLIAGPYDLKFKIQALPLKDELGGYRLLYSHNVQFPLSHAPQGDRLSVKLLTRVWPVLGTVLKNDADRVELVNEVMVEEVLQDLGTLEFGSGVKAKFNVAIWRERGVHLPLIGEFAFQVKFSKREEVPEKAVDRIRNFFVALQQIGHEYVTLAATKTGVVYKFRGDPPKSDE